MTAIARPLVPPAPGRRADQRRRLAAGASLALHLLLAGLLLIHISRPARFGLEPRRAVITLDLLPAAQPGSSAPAQSEARPPAAPAKLPAATHRVVEHRPIRRAPANPAPQPPVLQMAGNPPPSAALAAASASQAEPAVSSMPAAAPTVSASGATSASGGATGAEQILPLPMAYLIEVSRLINVHLQTSAWHAFARGKKTAVVHIHLARDGEVISVALVQSTGDGALDREACDVVLRIRKFPGIPDDVLRGDRDFAIDQPIRLTTV